MKFDPERGGLPRFVRGHGHGHPRVSRRFRLPEGRRGVVTRWSQLRPSHPKRGCGETDWHKDLPCFHGTRQVFFRLFRFWVQAAIVGVPPLGGKAIPAEAGTPTGCHSHLEPEEPLFCRSCNRCSQRGAVVFVMVSAGCPQRWRCMDAMLSGEVRSSRVLSAYGSGGAAPACARMGAAHSEAKSTPSLPARSPSHDQDVDATRRAAAFRRCTDHSLPCSLFRPGTGWRCAAQREGARGRYRLRRPGALDLPARHGRRQRH